MIVLPFRPIEWQSHVPEAKKVDNSTARKGQVTTESNKLISRFLEVEVVLYLSAEIEDFNLVFQTRALIVQIRDPLPGRVHVLRMKRVAYVAHDGHLGLHLDGGHIRSKRSGDSLVITHQEREETNQINNINNTGKVNCNRRSRGSMCVGTESRWGHILCDMEAKRTTTGEGNWKGRILLIGSRPFSATATSQKFRDLQSSISLFVRPPFPICKDWPDMCHSLQWCLFSSSSFLKKATRHVVFYLGPS